MKDTYPGVFIIESLTFEDEELGRAEGGILRDILRLSSRGADYLYIRTERELEVALERFYESRKRYLHLSCHGNDHSLALTLDHVTFSKFAELAKPVLEQRRLFISACEVVNSSFAAAVLP